ncbi:hypothetical protein OAT97_00040 [Gammaproteobacteria bacterium]|nr:hypothetical protein [Gammaproteobacteria bacterium]
MKKIHSFISKIYLAVLFYIASIQSTLAAKVDVQDIEEVETLTALITSAQDVIINIALGVLGLVAVGVIIAGWIVRVQVPWKQVGGVVAAAILIIVITKIVAFIAQAFT